MIHPIFIPVGNSGHLSDAEEKTFLGIFIILNLIFLIAFIKSLVYYFKQKEDTFSEVYFFDLNNEIIIFINWCCVIIDGLFILIYSGHLIGNLL